MSLPDNLPVRLLVDGDIIAFRAASGVQHVKIEDGIAQPVAFTYEGEARVDNLLFELMAGLNAAQVVICMTSPTNWRDGVCKTYKSNRDGLVRPLLLSYLRDYIRTEYGERAGYTVLEEPDLEADDLMGILGTDPEANSKFTQVICTKDKDLLSIPGWHHRMDDKDYKGRLNTFEVSPWEATRWHLIQTLAGDRTDGFAGCPGIGVARAEVIIDDPIRLVPQQGLITRGKNKGQATTKWVSEPTRDYWACIVSHYRKGGYEPESAEAAALETARLARILRHGEYDWDQKTIRLWTPDQINQDH